MKKTKTFDFWGKTSLNLAEEYTSGCIETLRCCCSDRVLHNDGYRKEYYRTINNKKTTLRGLVYLRHHNSTTKNQIV